MGPPARGFHCLANEGTRSLLTCVCVGCANEKESDLGIGGTSEGPGDPGDAILTSFTVGILLGQTTAEGSGFPPSRRLGHGA